MRKELREGKLSRVFKDWQTLHSHHSGFASMQVEVSNELSLAVRRQPPLPVPAVVEGLRRMWMDDWVDQTIRNCEINRGISGPPWLLISPGWGLVLLAVIPVSTDRSQPVRLTFSRDWGRPGSNGAIDAPVHQACSSTPDKPVCCSR